MTEYKDNIEHSNCTEESEIDLMEIVAKLWKGRKFILKCCAVGAVLGLIVAFSIPKRYSASAVLAPETDQRMGGSGMSSLASMMGVSLDNSVDAINAGMFPDVVHSVPFIFGLFDLEVSTIDGELSTTLLDYMLEHQRRAWWSYVLGIPGKAAGWLVSLFSDDAPECDGVLRMENLPERERGVVKYFSEGISVNVDKKTGKTSLSLEMQDPLVAATVMEAVVSNLKDYMCSYRTSKARQDVENLSVICAERKADYYRAQQAWAAYSDANKSVVLQSAQAERERLQQEMGLAYQVYSQVATQLEAARLKEQQAKPVFAVIEPVTVPLRKSARAARGSWRDSCSCWGARVPPGSCSGARLGIPCVGARADGPPPPSPRHSTAQWGREGGNIRTGCRQWRTGTEKQGQAKQGRGKAT